MNALLLLSIGLRIAGQTELPDWPPLPDEGEHVDYIKWYDDARRAGMKPEDDAFPLYQEIFPTVDDPDGKRPARTLFGGFRNGNYSIPRGYPRPWAPKSHPQWEDSYQRTRETIRRFKQAAALPYYYSPDKFGDGPRVLLSYRLPILSELRSCLKGMSEGAWRLEKGEIEIDAFLDYVRTALQAARQVERDPMLIAQLVAVAIRAMVYQDIQRAFHHRVFQARTSKTVKDIMDVEDTAIPTLDLAMRCECAVALDVMQFACERTGGGDEETFGPIRAAIRRGDLDREFCAEEISLYFKTMADALRTMRQIRSSELYVRIRIALESEESNAVLQVTAADYVRACELRLRAMSTQFATRLIVAMQLFRDEHSRWPNTLDELPVSIVSRFGTDPLSRKPFVYRLEQGKPLLYSLSTNGIDDGGCHDPHYGDRAPKSDFVYWPVNGGWRRPLIQTSKCPRFASTMHE